MQRCIYCRSELNQNTPPDDMTCSKEHIIQYALGGSNKFTTKDASRKYNADLGTTVDSRFVNLLPLAIKRHMLKIKGQSGTVPPIVWQAKSTKSGEPAQITIHADGRTEYVFNTVVVDDEKEKFTERLVAGTRDRVQTILAGMLSKTSKTGEVIFSKTGERMMEVDDFERHFEIEETDLFKGSIEAFDYEVWTRGIFKIILGLGHFILGSDWTFSADGGDRIRSVVFCKREQWPSQTMRGFSCGRLPSEIHTLLDITPSVIAANIHTIAILPNKNEVIAVVSLFGGDGVPEALVSLGSERGKLATVNDAMDPNTIVGVRIDPSTRVTTWISVADLHNADLS